MKTILKIIGLLIILILTFKAGMTFEREKQEFDSIGEPSYKFKNLFFDKYGARLYLKSKTWGLTGDHSETVLSLNSMTEFHPDSTKEFIFYGDKLIYRQTNDSLIVYYGELKSKPKIFNSPVKLKFIESDDYHTLKEQVMTGLHSFE
jgi:hypothetical protein